jgi:hypothetical protein
MKSKVIWALAVLNVALLSALLYRASGDNTARAQATPVRSSRDVIMIPGELPSGSNAVIYLVDVGGAPHTLSAMSYTGQGVGQGVEFLSPPVDLDRLFDRALTTTGNGGTGTGTGTGTGNRTGTGTGTGTRGGTRVR